MLAEGRAVSLAWEVLKKKKRLVHWGGWRSFGSKKNKTE